MAWSIWGLGASFYLVAFYQRVAPAVITDQLMAEFAIGGAALGNLSAFYFYAYVAMQIPTGVLADRWGPRRLLTAGASVAAVGAALFAVAPDFFWASVGRLLVGASVAVGFVSVLKLAAHWFPPQRFALASGLLLLMGLAGGVGAGVPLRLLVDEFGWRGVMGVSAAFTALLAAAIWWRVRDDPAELGYVGHHPGQTDTHAGGSILLGLVEVAANRNLMLLTLVPVGLAGAVLTFAGLWGVPYFRHVHGLDAKSAAAITSVMLIAWALGGPLLGSWSERMGRRKPIYAGMSLAALAGWVVLVLVPLPLPALVALLAAIGFTSGGLIIGFAWAKESVPPRLMGTAAGVANMGPLLGGMLLQPAVGWMLDRHWTGVLANGARIYDAAAYRQGFMLILSAVLVSTLLLFFVRETHCRQSA